VGEGMFDNTGFGPRLPSPNHLLAARVLVSLIPLEDGHGILLGHPPHAVAVLFDDSQMALGWSRFANGLLTAFEATEPHAPYHIIAMPREHRLQSAARRSADLMKRFIEQGPGKLVADWKHLMRADKADLQASMSEADLPRITDIELLSAADEDVVRILFQPREPSAHERLEFEAALRAAYPG